MPICKISSAIELSKNMMTLTGIWPLENPTLTYRLKKVITYASAFSIFCIMSLEVMVSLTDLVKLSEILFNYFLFATYNVKLITFDWNKIGVARLSKDLQDPLLNEYDRKYGGYVKKAIETSSFISKAFQYNCGITVLFLTLLPFLANQVFPIAFSFFHEGIMWYGIYTLQITGLAIGCWNQSAFDTLCIGYMSIAIAELDILLNKLRDFGNVKICNGDLESAAIKYLGNCYEHHNKIVEYIKNIEAVFSIGILAQFCGSIVVICNSGFQLIIAPLMSIQFITLLLYFTAMLIELAMYCWFGNEIIVKSLEINNACYMTTWYEFGPRVKKVMFIIMEGAKKPLTISAYKMSVLSLSAYMAVIKWSYSYFTLLTRLYMKD